jgi:uncharacterized membrane protein
MTLLPIALTIYILYWLAYTGEAILGRFIKLFLPKDLYIPGMGVVAGFVVVLAIGLLLQIWLVKKLFVWSEKIMGKIPLIKSLYSSIKDLMSFFDASKKKEFDKVVMVSFEGNDVRLMGLITREDFSKLPRGIGSEETVAVYLPMSYQMGGFTVMVPRSRIILVDMSIEQAMRFTLTAAMSTEKKDIT